MFGFDRPGCYSRCYSGVGSSDPTDGMRGARTLTPLLGGGWGPATQLQQVRSGCRLDVGDLGRAITALRELPSYGAAGLDGVPRSSFGGAAAALPPPWLTRGRAVWKGEASDLVEFQVPYLSDEEAVRLLSARYASRVVEPDFGAAEAPATGEQSEEAA